MDPTADDRTTCFLLSVEGSIEELPACAHVHEVLEPGPLHHIKLTTGWELVWSSAAYQHTQVNQCASSVSGHTVKGDAFITSACGGRLHDLQRLLRRGRTGRGSEAPRGRDAPGWAPPLRACAVSPPSQRDPCRRQQRIKDAAAHLSRIRPHMAAHGTAGGGGGGGNAGATAGGNAGVRAAEAPVAAADVRLAAGLAARGQRHLDTMIVQDQGDSLQLQQWQQQPQLASTPQQLLPAQSLPLPPHPALQHQLQHELPPSPPQPPPQQQQQRSGSVDLSPAPGHPACSDGAPGACSKHMRLSAGSTTCAEGPECCGAGGTQPVWQDLPEDMLCRIAGMMGSSVAAVMPLYSVSSAWRRAVLDDAQLLSRLTFTLASTGQPFRRHLQPLPPAVLRMYLAHSSRHPRILTKAAQLGNVSALVCCAQLLDAGGCASDAMRYWRRAAKAGQLEGQLRLGMAMYRGSWGVVADAEGAHLWLARALKQAQSLPAAPAEGARAQRQARDALILQRSVLQKAGLVLGYLTFDGDGCRKDAQEAVRYFKVAAAEGCSEAQHILGSLYNTGQFG